MRDGAPPATIGLVNRSRRQTVKSKHDKSREEQLAGEVLALVERFHRPAPDDHEHGGKSRWVGRLALPVALEALALASFAHTVRARHGLTEKPEARVRRGLRRTFAPRHL
jgi:hypothetical protein